MHTLANTDQSTDPLNALAITKPGFLKRAAETNKESLAAMAADLSPRELERATKRCGSFVDRLKLKMLEQRMVLGAVLHVIHGLHAGKGNGGFRRALELANIERRNGYRCLALFDLFGPHCVESAELLTHFSIEAAQTLATKATPAHIKERFIEQAKAGHDVTYSAVKRAIDAEKQTNTQSNTDQPWLDRQFDDGQIKLHCVIGQPPSRKQLKDAFQAALEAAISNLPPGEVS